MYIVLLCAVFLSISFAHNPASHDVRISIPHILRLKLQDGEHSILELDLEVEVSGVSYSINPGEVVLEVFANSDWQLLVRQQPQDEAIPLAWRSGADWRPLGTSDSLMLSGTKTGGWQAHSVHYGLSALPAAGVYRTTVIYTLTRP